MPAALYQLHRILIVLAISLGVLLLVYGLTQHRPLLGIGGALAGAALAFYLRWFLRKRKPG